MSSSCSKSLFTSPIEVAESQTTSQDFERPLPFTKISIAQGATNRHTGFKHYIRCYNTTAFQADMPNNTLCRADVLIYWCPFCFRKIWKRVSVQHFCSGRATNTFIAVFLCHVTILWRHWNRGLVCGPSAKLQTNQKMNLRS